jgi:signal transduction histidine kinase
MQTEAKRLKNDFGIKRSISLLGDFYYSLGLHYLSYFQYKKALDYGLKTKQVNMARTYYDVAQACVAMRRWNEAEEYLQQSIKLSTDVYFMVSPMTLLLKLYCTEDTVDSRKVDIAFEQLYHLHNTLLSLGDANETNYNEAMYCYYQFYKNDSLTAEIFRSKDIEIDSLSYYKYMGQKYEAAKKYEVACSYYYSFATYYMDNSAKAEKVQYSLLVPQFEYQELKLTNNQLLQDRTKIKLDEAKSESRLLALNNEKDRAYLLMRLKERSLLQNQLKAKEQLMKQQSRQIVYNKLKVRHKEEEQHLFKQTEYWKMIFIVLMSILILSLIGFFIILKRKERKRLRLEKEKAENSERTKSLFFQNMNHEIRSPLNAIVGFNEVLCSDVANSLSDEEKESFINMISTNSELLLTLVNDVLDLSNFESGTYKLVPVDVDIDTLCRTTVESIRGREAKGVALSFQSGGSFILHTDAQRLQQVLVNFLTNACKYTETGHITLSYEVLDDMVRFAVTDTGRGVKKEDSEIVFQRFQMLDKSKRGTGLGLHICRLISKLVHGRVYVDTNYSGGARFVFDHPIKGAILLLIGFIFSFLPINAQHNKQGIQDRIYTYYQKAYTEVGTDNFNAALQLFKNKAALSKDLKAQFMCLYLEAKHHDVRGDNMEKVLKLFNNSKSFAQCHHLSYYYYLAWSAIVNTEISSGKSSTAFHQLLAFQKSISKVKDPDIISLFLYETATFYLREEHPSIAISYLRQSLNYSKRRAAEIYMQMGACYYNLGDYRNTISIVLKAIESLPQNVLYTTACMRLLMCYSLLSDEKNATKYFKILESQKKRHGYVMSNISFYYYAIREYYASILKDDKKGEEATAGNEAPAVSFNVANYKYSIGRYEEAMHLYKDYMNTVEGYVHNDNALMLESFATKFDYEQDLAQKKHLDLSNMMLKLKRMENNKSILELIRQQTRWNLDKETTDANIKKSEIVLRDNRLAQQRLSMNQQEFIKHSLQNEESLVNQRTRWLFLTLSTLALLLITAALTYFINLWRKDRKLGREVDVAVELEQEKNLFFANVNGKIRQPLNTIIELNRAMSKCTDNDSSQRAEMMNKLRSSSDYLTKVVNRVLNISKMESGTFKLQNTDIDFRQLCLSELEKMKEKVHEGVEIIFCPAANDASMAESPCIIKTDGGQLQFVLDAYLDNAVDNTIDGSITLSYDIYPDKISFAVTNTGPAIDKDMVAKIFYCEKLPSNAGHIGMSLHIVRLLASLMHGRAYIDTNFLEGTRFVFEIPV